MKISSLKKKYNAQTGGYKIDILINGVYISSTEMRKTLKEAKLRFLSMHPDVDPATVKCYFDKH